MPRWWRRGELGRCRTLASAGLFDDIYVVHTQSIGMFSPRWTEMIYPTILAIGERDGRQWSAAGEELRRCAR